MSDGIKNNDGAEDPLAQPEAVPEVAEEALSTESEVEPKQEVVEPDSTLEEVEIPEEKIETETAEPPQAAPQEQKEELQPIEIPPSVETPSADPPEADQPPPPPPQTQVVTEKPSQSFVLQLLGRARAKIQERRHAKLDKLIQFAIKKRKITNDDVQKLLRVSHATAFRYLRNLEEKGQIRQVGSTGRGVFYEKI